MSETSQACPRTTANPAHVCTHESTLEQTLDALRRRFAELERKNSALHDELRKVRAEVTIASSALERAHEELSESVCTLGPEILDRLPTPLAQALRYGPSYGDGRVDVMRGSPALGNLLTWLLAAVPVPTPAEPYDKRAFGNACANVIRYVLVMQHEFNACRASRAGEENAR